MEVYFLPLWCICMSPVLETDEARRRDNKNIIKLCRNFNQNTIISYYEPIQMFAL